MEKMKMSGMKFGLVVGLWVSTIGFVVNQGAVDDICYLIETCENDPCDCGEDSNCVGCNGGQGCSECAENYFLPANDEKCMSCDLIDGCVACNKEWGCAECDTSRNCVRQKSGLCNVWVCDECDPLPTPVPTDKPTNEPSDKPSNEPTDRPSTSPTDKPSDSPTAAPTTYQELQEAAHNGYYSGTIDINEAYNYVTDDVTIILDGYGVVDMPTYWKLSGICDIQAKTAIDWIDVSAAARSMFSESWTFCDSTQFGCFYIHAVRHQLTNENGLITHHTTHWLEPTPEEYIIAKLNS